MPTKSYSSTTWILSDGSVVEDIPNQNRCADIWRLINPITQEPSNPEKDEPKQWIHTDY